MSGQYEMYETIEEIFAKGVAFDPQTAIAQEWRPMEKVCPNVIVNPRYAFGRPVIGKLYVPTDALYRQWRAEGGNKQRVASWYHVRIDEVEEAVEFQVRLNA